MFTDLGRLSNRSIFQRQLCSNFNVLVKMQILMPHSRDSNSRGRWRPGICIFTVTPAPPSFLNTFRHMLKNCLTVEKNKQTGRKICVVISFVCRMIPDKSRLLTETHFVGQQCATVWPLSSLSKFHVCWLAESRLQIYHFWIYFWKGSRAKYLPFHCEYIHKGPTIHIYSEKEISGENPKEKEIALWWGRCWGWYLQRSEAEQLLESINFNFIDFIVSQVSEMTDFRRFIISKSLVSKISLQRIFTVGLPALNQRNT